MGSRRDPGAALNCAATTTSDDPFFDALPSYESREPLDPGQSPAIPAESGEISFLEPQETPPAPPPPLPSALRRRRPASKSSHARRVSFAESKDSSLDSSGITSPRERRPEALLGSKNRELDDSASAVTSDPVGAESDQRPEASVDSSEATSAPKSGEDGDAESVQAGSLLEFAAGLVIKAVFFQINLLIVCFTFPVWLLRSVFLVVIDPFGTLKRFMNGVKARFLRVWKVLFEKISPSLYERLSRQYGMGKFTVKLVCAFFWSFCVCFMLFVLLVFAFLAGSLLIEGVLTKPVQVTQDLQLDYTHASPDAFVPLGSCGHGGFSRAQESWRLVPPNHKLQVSIALTLPESDYNRILGIFQVKVEFLSADGKLISSSSQPAMLRFKSSQIRLLETFLKSISLLSGYASESQTIKIKMKGFTEGTEPTTCLRVLLEQRAEYRPGAGIPEIYSASLKLESELPLLKRIIWNWRRTLLIWLSAVIFLFELLVVLVCLRQAIVPRGRPRSTTSSTA